jgi:hypothetical protein
MESIIINPIERAKVLLITKEHRSFSLGSLIKEHLKEKTFIREIYKGF